MTSTERFAWEWKKYSAIEPAQELQFNKWTAPLKEGFKDKVILDAGCGNGRNSYWMIRKNAKSIQAFDYDLDTVKTASYNLSYYYPEVNVFYKSIYNIKFENEFDLVISLGVIHHLEYPKKAMQKLYNATKEGGKCLIGVYAYEGNEKIVKYINPIRKITSRLPIRLTHLIAYFFSIPLYVFVRTFAKGEYFEMLRHFKFRQIHSICFDQLIPRIANYWKKEEVLELMKPFKNVTIHKINNNWWTAIGEK